MKLIFHCLFEWKEKWRTLQIKFKLKLFRWTQSLVLVTASSTSNLRHLVHKSATEGIETAELFRNQVVLPISIPELFKWRMAVYTDTHKATRTGRGRNFFVMEIDPLCGTEKSQQGRPVHFDISSLTLSDFHIFLFRLMSFDFSKKMFNYVGGRLNDSTESYLNVVS